MQRIGTGFMVLLATSAVASCGGDDNNGDGATTTEAAEVDQEEIGQAFSAMVDKCIDISFGLGGSGARSAVSSAVDDLIRNYNINPDAALDIRSLKPQTPTEVLEASLDFLEKQECSLEDGQRVHQALAAAPESSSETSSTPSNASDSA